MVEQGASRVRRLQGRVQQCRWALFPTGVFLCTRVALFAFSYLALTFTPNIYLGGGPREFRRPHTRAGRPLPPR